MRDSERNKERQRQTEPAREIQSERKRIKETVYSMYLVLSKLAGKDRDKDRQNLRER